MSGRVRIGTCSGPADAALVRSVFTARGFHVVIGAEHHGGMFAGLGGFLSLDIWVAEEDAEDAAALLQDLREHDASGDGDVPEDGLDGADGPHEGDDAQLDALATGDDPGEAEGDEARAQSGLSVEQRSSRRRDTAYILLLGCTIGFGTAHMFTRAWGRGFALAGFQLLGLVQAVSGSTPGLVILIAAKLLDVGGALWRVRTAPTTALPVARIHGS